jgi:hypothetical protein
VQRLERARALAFLERLWANRDAVRASGGEYQVARLSVGTSLVQFETVVSLLLFCTRHRTSYAVDGTGAATVRRVAATGTSLLLGWWGFPGLFWTVAALVRIAVYPDSKKVGLLGGRASVDANGAPLVQVSPYGETLGYYDGEDD